MQLHVRFLALMTAATVLGCGQAAPNRPKRPSPARAPIAKAFQAPGAPAMDGAMKGSALLEQTRKAMAQATGFEVEITSHTQGRYKGGKRVDEVVRGSISCKVVWQKPWKFRATVIETSNPLMEGGSLVTRDGVDFTARARGILGLFPMRVSARDPQLTNARNHTFDKYCPMIQMQRLIGPTAVWTVVAEAVAPGGALVAQVAIDGVKRLDGEIDREIFAVEVATLAPRSLTAYAGSERAAHHVFEKFRWSPKVSPETFEL